MTQAKQADLCRVETLAKEHRAGKEPWTDAELESFLNAAESENLQYHASRIIADHIQTLARDNPNAATRITLETKPVLRALAWIRLEQRADFELFLTNLRESGAKAKNVASVERSVNQVLNRVKRDKISHITSNSQLKLVDANLGAPVPEKLLLPIGISITETGVFQEEIDRDGNPIKHKISPTPVLICSRLKDTATGQESTELTWMRDGQWQRHIASRETIADARSIVRLSAFGFPVNSATATDMVEFLGAFEATNETILTPRQVTNRLGWHQVDGEDLFLWGRNLLAGDDQVGVGSTTGEGNPIPPLAFRGDDEGEEQLVVGFTNGGSFEEWRDGIVPVIGFPKAIIAIVGALSTPLLRILNAFSPILSVSSPTSRGKTTVLRLAGSVWGNPDERTLGSVVRTWDSTAVFIERVAGLNNDLPLLLDETSLAKGHNRRMIEKVIYSLSGGQGRGRGSVQGLRTAGAWRTCLLSTGEQPLTSFLQNAGGAHARVLELCGPPFGEGNQAFLVNRIREVVTRNFGHAGPRFVIYLLRNREEWPAFREAYGDAIASCREKTGDSPVAGRMGNSVALLYFTATLASREFSGILPWSIRELHGAISTIWDDVLEGADRSDVAREALSYTLSWAFRNRDRFWEIEADNRDEPHDGWAGRWDRRGSGPVLLSFFPDKLEDLLQKREYSPEAIFAQWREKGWIKTSGNRRRLQMRILGRQVQVIALTQDAANAVGFSERDGPDEIIPSPEQEETQC